MASASPTAPTFSSAYAVFEGGGARGLAHVGALRALEEEGHALIGVAGTSAGAIVAALVAVGYRPDEIFTSGTQNIITKINPDGPISVLGKKDWNRFRKVKWRIGIIILGFFIPLITLPVWFIWDLIFKLNHQVDDFVGNFRIAIFVWIGGLIISIIAGLWFFTILKKRGIFETESISQIINTALQIKLKQHYQNLGLPKAVPAIITFQDIDPASISQCIPLKIVVTNVNNGALEVFGNTDSDVPVGDVVAASAAIPGAFRPASIQHGKRFSGVLFADGGLVSNMPSWVFRDEKKARERFETISGSTSTIPVYAFSLENYEKGADNSADSKSSDNSILLTTYKVLVVLSRYAFKWLMGPLQYAVDVVSVGIFGSQAVVADFIPDLKVISLRTALRSIDFDCTPAAAEAAVKLGYQDAKAYLKRERFLKNFTELALEDLLSELETEIALLRSPVAHPPRLRLFLIDPIRGRQEIGVRGFRISAAAGSDTHADDRLELDKYNSVAASAFWDHKAVYRRVKDLTAEQMFMTKYEKALLPSDLDSIIAVPIFLADANGPVPERVLTLDSSDDLLGEFNDPAFMAMLAVEAASLSGKLIEGLYTEEIQKGRS